MGDPGDVVILSVFASTHFHTLVCNYRLVTIIWGIDIAPLAYHTRLLTVFYNTCGGVIKRSTSVLAILLLYTMSVC